MAEYYVKCIRSVQPHGPYYLSGFCFGGLVVYEMARHLTSENENVALLAIFDSPAPASLTVFDCVKNRIRHDLWKLRRREVPLSFPIMSNRIRRVLRHSLRFLKGTISGIGGLAPPKSAKDLERELLDVSYTNVAAAKSYHPGAYSGPITLFLTSEAYALYGTDLRDRWLPFGPGGIEFHSSEGEHLKQLEDPHVRSLAEELEKCIALTVGPNRGSPGGFGQEAPSHERGKGPGALAQLS